MASKRKRDTPEHDVICLLDDDSDDDGAAAARAGAGTGAAAPRGAPALQRRAPAPSFELLEQRGDLFCAGAGVSLVHCVARDLRLGKARVGRALPRACCAPNGATMR